MNIKKTGIENGLKFYIDEDSTIFATTKQIDNSIEIKFWYKNVFQNKYHEDDIGLAENRIKSLMINAYQKSKIDENKNIKMEKLVLKNMKSYDEFLLEKSLLGKMFNFLGGKLKKYATKVKSAKKIDPIIDEAKSDIEGYFSNKKYIDDIKRKNNVSQSQNEAVDNKDEANSELDKAINGRIELAKKKVEVFTKDDKGKEIYQARMYAQLKFVELEETIIKKRVEFLVGVVGMDEKDANNKYNDKLTEMKNKQAEVIKGLETALNKSQGENSELIKDFKKGEIYNYVTTDGKKEKIVITSVNDRGEIQARRISDIDDDKKPAESVGDEFNPLTKNISSIGEEYIEDYKKSFSELIKDYQE